MSLSIFDLFKVGIGPSSSHTVGPMWAAHRYRQRLVEQVELPNDASLRVHLFGSLALTGVGHATDTALILGCAGEQPDQIDPDQADRQVAEIRRHRQVLLSNGQLLPFDPELAILFHPHHELPEHPNGLRFEVLDRTGDVIDQQEYFSVGGGFVLKKEDFSEAAHIDETQEPYPFDSAAQLLALCDEHQCAIDWLVRANEAVQGSSADQVDAGLDRIWAVMEGCIDRGCREEGELPGGLNVKRRAAKIRRELLAHPEAGLKDPLTVMDWVSLYALAVNEENAAGGRVVTAPTNGAAGVIPAVLAYYMRCVSGSDRAGMHRFLITAAAIGMLYKKNASISAAEVGCQGEIGVACSMAAAGLAAVMGGTPGQIENAAEIGMEHNLGMTCDPVGGLVQVPCIERNTMGAIKAINAARLAMRGDGEHRVSLDSVIETMHQTGKDMQSKYKETALGGLAVNVVLC